MNKEEKREIIIITSITLICFIGLCLTLTKTIGNKVTNVPLDFHNNIIYPKIAKKGYIKLINE